MKIPAQPQMRFLGKFGGVVAGAVRMTGDSPWEMHPGGDECLHLLSGAIVRRISSLMVRDLTRTRRRYARRVVVVT